MTNFTLNNLSFPYDSEIRAHMPQLFQLMIRVQQGAEQKFNNIVEDVELGKITIEEIKRERGGL